MSSLMTLGSLLGHVLTHPNVVMAWPHCCVRSYSEVVLGKTTTKTIQHPTTKDCVPVKMILLSYCCLYHFLCCSLWSRGRACCRAASVPAILTVLSAVPLGHKQSMPCCLQIWCFSFLVDCPFIQVCLSLILLREQQQECRGHSDQPHFFTSRCLMEMAEKVHFNPVVILGWQFEFWKKS